MSYSYNGPTYSNPNDPFDGATLRRAKEVLSQAEAMLAQAHTEKRETMALLNQALWCDITEHAFSAKDKAKRSITMSQWDEDKGQDVEVIVMACGPCAKVNPLIQAAQPDRPVSSAMINAPSSVYDPEYTARLERELGQPGPR